MTRPLTDHLQSPRAASDYHLAVLHGAGGFAPVAKTLKGLTDDEFWAMTAQLQALRVQDDRHTLRAILTDGFIRLYLIINSSCNDIMTGL